MGRILNLQFYTPKQEHVADLLASYDEERQSDPNPGGPERMEVGRREAEERN